jgi:hypothetical protein
LLALEIRNKKSCCPVDAKFRQARLPVAKILQQIALAQAPVGGKK